MDRSVNSSSRTKSLSAPPGSVLVPTGPPPLPLRHVGLEDGAGESLEVGVREVFGEARAGQNVADELPGFRHLPLCWPTPAMRRSSSVEYLDVSTTGSSAGAVRSILAFSPQSA